MCYGQMVSATLLLCTILVCLKLSVGFEMETKLLVQTELETQSLCELPVAVMTEWVKNMTGSCKVEWVKIMTGYLKVEWLKFMTERPLKSV